VDTLDGKARRRRHGRGLGLATPLTGGCKASQETCLIRFQGYRPRKLSEGLTGPSVRRFENTLMDEGRFAKKGSFLLDQSRLLQELPERLTSGCRPVSLGPSAF
jgi:hypothetical protein